MRHLVDQEVRALHVFFEGWFAREQGELSRVEHALADDFVLYSPRGKVVSRAQLLTGLRESRGCFADRSFSIEIRECRIRHLEWGIAVVTYEEWQHLEARSAGRMSTAVFKRSAAAPNGVQWLHLHETWLPGGAPAK